MGDWYNASYDMLVEGNVTRSVVKLYEDGWTFNGISWIWPLAFMGTLVWIYKRTESPTAVAIFTIIGNFLLKAYLPAATQPLFYGTLAFTTLFTLYSFFVSDRTP